MAFADSHPSSADLEAFALGALDNSSSPAVEIHVASCTTCQERAAGVSADTLVALLRRAHDQTPVPIETMTQATWQMPTTPPVTRDALSTPAAPPSAEAGADALAGVPTELRQHARYRVLRLLGEGGMGSVYEAEHCVMRRSVALKVIHQAYTARAGAVERFQREVRAAARLAHPNIVAAYDAEQVGATHFLVMEYVEGVTLDRLVQERGPLPVAEACAYVRQAALGLQHAHECGMVHRDVKPGNLIRCPDSAVKVLDFGLAVLTAERGDGLTDTNVVMGTPDYMAPEQAEDARSADVRADVYSLGCTLHYLLTGRPPFEAPTALLKLLAHRQQPAPDVRRARPEAPAGLAAVLERMLAKKPGDRYQTPGEAASALRPFAEPLAGPPRKRPPLLAALALAAVFGGLLLAGTVVYRIQTDAGELVITTEGDDVEVAVKQGGKVVDIIDTKTQQSLRLHSGVYELELKGAPAGLKLDITKATLMRDKTVVATIERLPRTEPPAPANPTPLTPAAANPAPLTPPAPVISEIQLLHHVSVPRGNDWYHYLSVSGDGKLVAAAVGADGGKPAGIAVWDGATGKERYRLEGRWMGWLTPDGAKLVAHDKHGPGDWSCRVYDAPTGNELRSIRFETPLEAYHLLPGSRYAVMWSRDGKAHIVDLETGEIRHSWTWEKDNLIQNYGFTDDGRVVFIWPRGSPHWIAWDLQANAPSAEFGNVVKYPSFSLLPGNRQAGVPAAEIGKWLLLDVADGKTTPPPEHGPSPNDVTHENAMLDLRLYLHGNADGRLYSDDYWTFRETASFQLPNGQRLQKGDLTAISPEGKYACVQTEDSLYFLRLVQAPPAAAAPAPLTPPQPVATEIKLLHHISVPWNDGYHCLTVSRDGERVAAGVGGKPASIAVWDGKTGNELCRLKNCSGGKLTPDGAKLLAHDDSGPEADHRCSLYDAATGKKLRTFRFDAWLNSDFLILPDSRHAVLATEGREGQLCDLETGDVLHRWRYKDFLTAQGRYTDDGRVVFILPVGSARLVAWDVVNNRPSTEFDQVVKFSYVGGLLPGNKQALVNTAEEGEHQYVNVADGSTMPFPDRTWPPFVVGGSALLDVRINLIGDANGRVCTFDYLTGRETASLQLPDGQRLKQDDLIALSPEGGYACVQTQDSLYFLRLVQAPPTGKQP